MGHVLIAETTLPFHPTGLVVSRSVGGSGAGSPLVRGVPAHGVAVLAGPWATDVISAFVAAGLGAGWERYVGRTATNLLTDGDVWKPEVRLEAGGWWRVSDDLSLLLTYRSRFLAGGDAADPVSELVRLGGTRSPVHTPEIELGVAWHVF